MTECFVIKHMTTRGKLHRQRAAIGYPVTVQSHGAGVEVTPVLVGPDQRPAFAVSLITGDDPQTGKRRRIVGTVMDSPDGPLWMPDPANRGDVLLANTHHVG